MDHIIFVASFVNHLISDTEKFDMDERQKERPHCLANNAALRFGDYEWTSSLATRGQYLPLCSYILYFRSFNTNVHSPQSSKKMVIPGGFEPEKVKKVVKYQCLLNESIYVNVSRQLNCQFLTYIISLVHRGRTPERRMLISIL